MDRMLSKVKEYMHEEKEYKKYSAMSRSLLNLAERSSLLVIATIRPSTLARSRKDPFPGIPT